jgi:hypothetical protein
MDLIAICRRPFSFFTPTDFYTIFYEYFNFSTYSRIHPLANKKTEFQATGLGCLELSWKAVIVTGTLPQKSHSDSVVRWIFVLPFIDTIPNPVPEGQGIRGI